MEQSSKPTMATENLLPRALSGIVLAIIIASSGLCLGQEQEQELDPALAKEKFEEGMEKIRTGEYQAALEAFEESYCAKPKAIVTFNIAMCQKALYNYALALAAFSKYLKEAGETPKPDLRKEARAAIAEIEELVGMVIVTGAPDGAKVYFDDEFIGETPLKEPVAVNPGRYVARIVPEEGEPFETIVAAVAGAVVRVNANLKTIPKPKEPKPDKPVPPKKRERGRYYVGKITLISLGLASGVAGIVFTARGQQAYNEGLRMIETGVGGVEYVSQWNIDEYNDLRQQIPKYRTGMIVSYTIAAALIGTGIAFAVLDARQDRDKNVSLRLVPNGLIGEF